MALARTLVAAAARDPHSTWCITVTGPDHRPVAHGCGRPPPSGSGKPGSRRPDQASEPGQSGHTARVGPSYAPAGDHDPPGSGTLRLNIAIVTGNGADAGTSGTAAPAGGAQELVFVLENLAGPCDHAHEAVGHDPGVKLKHLTEILNPYCTFPPCRRPHANCDWEHSTPHDKGGRTCLCQGGPVCRRNHRNKQAPGWHLEHGEARGWFRWTTASGRTYTSRPAQYPD